MIFLLLVFFSLNSESINNKHLAFRARYIYIDQHCILLYARPPGHRLTRDAGPKPQGPYIVGQASRPRLILWGRPSVTLHARGVNSARVTNELKYYTVLQLDCLLMHWRRKNTQHARRIRVVSCTYFTDDTPRS